MKVIVGLGNPGQEYARTRHNVGWMLLDSLVREWGASRFRPEKTVEASEVSRNGEKIYLLKPQTFMNRSGQAFAAWLGRFKDIREALQEGAKNVPLEARQKPIAGGMKADADECIWPGLLLVSDDVNLPLGKIRIRSSGSAGGHNGLKDVEKVLGGRGYPRLRLGVGAPPERMDRADYVLGRFVPDDVPYLEHMIATSAKAVEDWLDLGLELTRNKYNGRE